MKINDHFIIPDSEISEKFIRSGGPGGQNINKVSTSVQLVININLSRSIPDGIKRRLKKLAGKRLSADGILRIEANRFRSQEKNREDARERLLELILNSSTDPKKRIRTNPSYRARQKRIDQKKKRGNIKANRRKIIPNDFA